MLTAKTHEAEKVLGLEIGADDYVTKPFSPRELRARVKAVLRRTGKTNPSICRFGDVEVDFGRCELRRAGKPVELTALEFKLLAALVRNSGKVLSRDQLLDLVWGHGTFVTDRVVDNHVVTLRKKIEPEPRRRGTSSASAAWATVSTAERNRIVTIPNMRLTLSCILLARRALDEADPLAASRRSAAGLRRSGQGSGRKWRSRRPSRRKRSTAT